MASFPAIPLPAITELLINGSWADVSSRVRDTDDDPGVAITRGQSPESQQAQPSRMSLSFDNRDGALSNRLPTATYYGQLGRNTQIRQRLRWVYDTFSRNASNGFGSDESGMGNVWTTSGGTSSDFSVSTSAPGGSMAGILFSAAARKGAETGPVLLDCRIAGQVKPAVVATGAEIDMGFTLRRDDPSDTHYEVLVRFEPGATMRLRINRTVSGSVTNVAEVVLSGSYTANSFMAIVADINGNRIRARAWNASFADPLTWQLTYTDTTAPITAPGQMGGPLCRVQSGNTNTPLTVWFNEIDVSDYRFWGEVAAWPPVSDITGRDVTIPIEAAGILRRLGTSAKPIRSALNRAMAGVSAGDFTPIAYWPMEDGSQATQFASALAGQPAAAAPADFSPGSYSGFVGSDPLPVLRDGQLTCSLPSYVDTGQWQIQFTLMIPSSGFSNNATLAIVDMVAGHATDKIFLTYIQATGALRLSANNAAGTTLASSDTFTGDVQRDTPYLFAITDFVTSGNHTIALTIYRTDGTGSLQITVLPDGFGAGTAGQPYRFTAYATSVSSGWSLGHVALYTADVISTPNIGPNAQAAGGYVGETAADRMSRLFREEGISFELVGNASDTPAMGPQIGGTLVANAYDCAAADLGLLYEPRDALAVGYRTRTSLYNQTGPTLTYSAGEVAPPFEPTEDDQLLVNDATARRPNGSVARVAITSGSLSTQDPPNGAGVYDEDRSYNVQADSQLDGIASWRARQGTWDEFRFQAVTVNLARLYRDAKSTLAGQVAAVDVGGYLAVDGTPAWLPPDTIEMTAYGYRETHRNFQWLITFNTAPNGPLQVGVWDDDSETRWGSDTSSLAVGVNTTAVSFSVQGSDTPDDLWITGSSPTPPFPIPAVIEGEAVTITAISGSSSPQTFTVTRSVNGVVKSHSANAKIYIRPRSRWAL